MTRQQMDNISRKVDSTPLPNTSKAPRTSERGAFWAIARVALIFRCCLCFFLFLFLFWSSFKTSKIKHSVDLFFPAARKKTLESTIPVVRITKHQKFTVPWCGSRAATPKKLSESTIPAVSLFALASKNMKNRPSRADLFA